MCTTISSSINLSFSDIIYIFFIFFIINKEIKYLFSFMWANTSIHCVMPILDWCYSLPVIFFYNIYFTSLLLFFSLYVLCNFLWNMFKHKRAIWFHYFLDNVCLPWQLGCSIYTMILICSMYNQKSLCLWLYSSKIK